MKPKSKEIEFTICGQDFRLRASGEDAKTIRRVASRVDKCIRGYKGKRASSDVRAAVMAAYELAFELEEFRNSKKVGTEVIDNANSAIDRLIARLDEQMDDGDEASSQEDGGAESKKKKKDSASEEIADSQNDMFADHS